MPRQFARRPYFRSVRGIMFAFSKLRKKTRARGPRGCRTSLILALCLTHSTSAAAARGHQSRGPKAPTVAHWRVSNAPSPRRARLRSTAWRARSSGAVSAARSRTTQVYRVHLGRRRRVAPRAPPAAAHWCESTFECEESRVCGAVARVFGFWLVRSDLCDVLTTLGRTAE